MRQKLAPCFVDLLNPALTHISVVSAMWTVVCKHAAHFSQSFEVQAHIRKICELDSASAWQRMQILGPLHPFFWNCPRSRLLLLQSIIKNSIFWGGHLDYHIWYACSSLRPLSIQYLYADLAMKIRCLFHLQITSSHSLPPGGHFCIRLLSYRAYVWAIASACALISKSHLFRCHKRPMDTFLLVASSKTFILRYRQLAVKILSITDILSY